MAMTLEPPGLDPTNAAAAAIAEVTLYNVYETLTKIKEDGSVSPLLAESWQASPDLKTYTFKLRKGVKFHNGEPFDSAAVKFSYERNAAPTSTNKDKSLFQSFASVTAPDAETVVITMKIPNRTCRSCSGRLGLDRRAEERADRCDAAGRHRAVHAGRLGQGIVDHAQQMAGLSQRGRDQAKQGDDPLHQRSLRAGRGAAVGRRRCVSPGRRGRSLAQFKSDPRFNVLIGGSKAKTIVAINNKQKPFDDVRVRRAILAAIDRKAMIEGAVDGFGMPIGSFYTPGSLGYVDTTDINPYDTEKAKKLLAEAGVTTPLEVSLKLPPPPYARQGGEILAAQLAKVGIIAKIENLEWAQWLSQVFAGNGPHNFDLTIVSHVEPFDLVKLTESDYYMGYNAGLSTRSTSRSGNARRGRSRQAARRRPAHAGDRRGRRLPVPAATDHISSKKLKGMWKEVPQFENDFSAWSWE